MNGVMRRVSTMILALVLTACGSQKELAFNRYSIDTRYGDDTDTSYEEALARLDREARRTCADGYRKIHDYDTSIEGDRTLVWEITCKGVERAESEGVRTRPPHI
jgi:hypothetical protein